MDPPDLQVAAFAVGREFILDVVVPCRTRPDFGNERERVTVFLELQRAPGEPFRIRLSAVRGPTVTDPMPTAQDPRRAD